MIATILAPLIYVILTCLHQKKNVINYIMDNKVMLGLTVLCLIALSVFGKTATMVVLTTFLVPYLMTYSIPSLLTKLVGIWNNIVAYFTTTKV